mmetsp:Transcript_11278/g.42099  ORF Transcript_11278/g.42099 Transcript_11278/m.42099 type:complete len:215 (+) Transcript_11278:442-1086(+)
MSNMNSCGSWGASSGCSCSCSSFSSTSCSSCSVSGSSRSCDGGGGGGGGGGICTSGSISGFSMNELRGRIASRTARRRSSASIWRPSSAADARAICTAKSSARWPWQPERVASSQMYCSCASLMGVSFKSSRANTMRVFSWSSWSITSSHVSRSGAPSGASSEGAGGFILPPPKPSTPSTASRRCSSVRGTESTLREMAMRSRMWSRTSFSSGL